MQKSKFTKLLCLVLSLMMILCAAPITTFAASADWVFPTYDYSKSPYSSTGKISFDVVIRNTNKDYSYVVTAISITDGFNLTSADLPFTVSAEGSQTVNVAATVSSKVPGSLTFTYNVVDASAAVIDEGLSDTLYFNANKGLVTDSELSVGGQSGISCTYPKVIYATSVEELCNTTIVVENTGSTAVTGFMTTKQSNLKTCFIGDYIAFAKTEVNIPAHGKTTVKMFETTSAYDALTAEQKATLWNSFCTTTYSGVDWSYVRYGGYFAYGLEEGLTYVTNITVVLFEDYGLKDMLAQEEAMHRQARDYDCKNGEWDTYMTALFNAATFFYEARVAGTWAGTGSTSSVRKIKDYAEALAAAIENLDKCYVSPVTHTHTFENGVCTDCGFKCTHTFEDGTCTVCGMPDKITASELCALLKGQKFVKSDGLVLSIMDYGTVVMPLFDTNFLSSTPSTTKVPVTSYGYTLTVQTTSNTNVFDFYTDADGFSKVVCSGLKVEERNGEYYPYHPVTEVTVKDATCTEDGATTAYWICTDEGCGKAFTDVSCKTEIPAETLATYIIPATGHDFTGDYVPGTGDNAGKHARKCVNTGCTAVGLEDVANAYETCTGMEDDFTCDVCGYVDEAAALAEAKEETEEWFLAPLNTLVLGYYSPELVEELIEGLDDLTSPEEIQQYKEDCVSKIREARDAAFEDDAYSAIVNEITALAEALGFDDEEKADILADFDEFLAEDYEGKTVEEVFAALDEELNDAEEEEAKNSAAAKFCFSLILTFNSDWAAEATQTEEDMNFSLIWSTMMFDDNEKFAEVIEAEEFGKLGRLVPECYPDYIQSYARAAFDDAGDTFDTAFAALMGDVKEAKADAELAEAKADAAADVEALASDDDSDEVKAIIEKALDDIETAENEAAVEAIVEKAEQDVADQKAAEALAAAKTEAKTEINDSVGEEESDAVKAIAAEATAKIDEAETIEDIDDIVEECKEMIKVQQTREDYISSFEGIIAEGIYSDKIVEMVEGFIEDVKDIDTMEELEAFFGACDVKLAHQFFRDEACDELLALAGETPSDEVMEIINDAIDAIQSIEDTPDFDDVYEDLFDAIIDQAKEDVADQKALEADMAAFEEYKLAQAENCAKLEQDGDSQSVKDVIAATTTVISMASYDEDKTLAQNKAKIDKLVGDLENNLPVMRAYEAAVAEITEAAGEAPSEAVQAILDQAFSDLANADNVEAINDVKELALEDVAEQQAAEAAEALAALKGATITIINTMKGNAVSDEAKALADEAIEAVENAESIEELDAAFSGLEEAMEAKDAEFAETKDDAKTAIEALAGDDASDEVKAIVEKALADIEKATSKEALAQIAADAEKDVDEQQAAEAAAALAAAKEAAKAAIDAAIEADDNEAVTAVAEEAKAAIENAESIEKVEEIMNLALESMEDARGRCPYCGEKEHDSLISKLSCFAKRIVALFAMVVEFIQKIVSIG